MKRYFVFECEDCHQKFKIASNIVPEDIMKKGFTEEQAKEMLEEKIILEKEIKEMINPSLRLNKEAELCRLELRLMTIVGPEYVEFYNIAFSDEEEDKKLPKKCPMCRANYLNKGYGKIR